MSDDQSADQSADQFESGVTFIGFVVSLAHTAAVHFGDVPDPVSGETMPSNLPAAQQMIDILALLEEKTRGNLTAEERNLLDQILERRLRILGRSHEWIQIHNDDIDQGDAMTRDRVEIIRS